jgi:hypothetical protein
VKKLHHPTIPGKSVTVPDAKVEDWIEQGWRKSAPRRKAARKPTT